MPEQDRFRHALALLVMALMLVATTTVSFAHRAMTVHAWCAEHGTVLELHGGTFGHPDDPGVPTLRQASLDAGHDDDCQFPVVPVAGRALALPTVPRECAAGRPSLPLSTASPHGVSLLDAPKTSPPASARA